MKTILLITFIFNLITGPSFSQKLLDIYKNGPVKLIPEKTYGIKNDWPALFNLYSNTEEGSDKKIILAPDGSVFMSHKNRHEIWKFGPDGNFIKRFGNKGGKSYQFPMMPSVEGIADGKYVFTTDANARLKFFDLDGNYFKSITLKYMTRDFQPVGNGEILLEGNVMWKDQEPGTRYIMYRWRHIIVKLNIYTGEEKILYSVFEEPDFKYLNTKNPDSMKMVSIPPPDNKRYLPGYMVFKRPEFVMLKDGRFIVLNRSNGNVSVFEKTGREINSFKLDIKPVAVTEKDALENYEATRQMLIKSIDRAKAWRDSTRISKGERGTTPGTIIKVFTNSDEVIKRSEEALTKIEAYKDINTYYPNLPYFSNTILDNEGNLLVFEFTDKEQTEKNIFNVIAYDANGQKLARTSFICDDYDLDFSENTFVISQGYVYAVAKLKNATGVPLRLVKFRMTSQN